MDTRSVEPTPDACGVVARLAAVVGGLVGGVVVGVVVVLVVEVAGLVVGVVVAGAVLVVPAVGRPLLLVLPHAARTAPSRAIVANPVVLRTRMMSLLSTASP